VNKPRTEGLVSGEADPATAGQRPLQVLPCPFSAQQGPKLMQEIHMLTDN